MLFQIALLRVALASLSQLQQESQINQAVASRLPVAYLQIDSDAHIQFASQPAVELLNASAAELLGDSLLPWLQASQRNSFRQQLQQVLTSDTAELTLSQTLQPRHGQPIGVSSQLFALAETASDRALLIWTPQVEAPAPLSSTEERYELALSGGEVGIWDWDIESGQMYLSPNLKALLGYNDDEIENHIEAWSRHVYREDREMVSQKTQQYLNGDCDRYELEHRMQHKDGSVRWVLARGTLLRDEAGRPHRFIGSDTDITAFKQTSAALNESRSRLQHIVSNIPGMVFDYTLYPDGKDAITYASPGCEEIFEIPPEQAEADADFLRDRIHPEDRDIAQTSILRSAQTLQPWNFEWRVTVPSGVEKWLRGISKPERHEDGRIVWNGIIFDITDRREAEDNLHDLAQRLLTVIETVDEGITLSDEAGNFGLYNAKMAEITGYSGVEAQQSEDFLHQIYPDPAERQQARDRLRAVRENGCIRNVETTIQAKDGSQKTLLVSTTFVPLSERYCYLSAYRNITDRKRAYDRLHQSQQFIEAVANASPQILYILQLPDFTVTYVNHQYQAITGHAEQDLLGQSLSQWSQRWHPDDLHRLQPYLKKLCDRDDSEVSEIQYRLHHADGSYRWLQSRDVIFERHPDGRVSKILGTATDITERKRVQMRLAESESQLNAIVNSISDGIAIIDRHGIVRFGNDAAARLFGRPLETFLNSSLGQPLTTGDAIELDLIRPDGQRRHIECAIDTVSWQGQNATILSLRDITRRRQTETALRESEIRFRQLAENIEAAFWLVDPHAQAFLYTSPAYHHIWGTSSKTSIAASAATPEGGRLAFRSRFDRVHPQDRPRVEEFFQQQMRGDRVTCEYRLVRPDGVRWVRDRAFPIYDRQNQLNRIAGITEDITERHFAEAALRASEVALRASQDRLNSILASLDDVVWSMCPHTGQLLYVSPAVERVHGKAPQDLTNRGNPWLADVHPGDRARIGRQWQQLLQLGSFDLEYRLDSTASTAETRWVRMRARLIGDERGQPLRVDGITSDMTQIKHTEIALRQSEARFRSLVANVPGAIYRCLPDRYWTTLFISDAIVEMTGYPPSVFLGNPQFWHRIIHSEDLPRLAQAINTAIAAHHSYSCEYRITCADGSLRWFYERGQGLWDEWGNLLFLDGTLVDITDRKRTERILQQQSRRDRLLNTLTQRIRQSLDLQDILDSTVGEVRQWLQADRVLLFYLGPDRSGRVVSESVLGDYPTCLGMEFPDEEFPHRCYQDYLTGNVRIVPDAANDEVADCLQEYMQEMQVRSKIVVPILDSTIPQAELWGLLIAHQCSDYRQWQDWEAEMLSQLAAQVGIAIGQAKLYAQVQRNEVRLRTLFEQAAVGIAILDHEGRVRETNPKFRTILSLPDPQRGLRISTPFIPFEEISYAENNLVGFNLEALADSTFERKYPRPNGASVWVQWTVSAFREAQSGDREAFGTRNRAFLAIVQDISDRKYAQLRLHRQLNLETALARVSRELALDDNADVSTLLGILGDPIGADRVYLARFDFRAMEAFWTAEWCNANTPSLMEALQGVDLTACQWWLDKLTADVTMTVNCVDDLPEAAHQERTSLQQLGIKSLLEVPICDRRGQLWGCVGFAVVHQDSHEWTEEEVQVLRLVGEILYTYWERRRVEAALRESEERFRATFEQAAVGIAQLDLEGRFLRVNHRYCQLVGYSARELLQLKLSDLLHPEDISSTETTFERILAGEIDADACEKRYCCQDGSLRWAQVTAAVVRDRHQTPKYIICASADIHDRKQYQAALERLRHRYELILNAAGEGICEIDLQGRIAFCNPTAAQMLGASRAIDIIGVPVTELFVGSSSQALCEVELRSFSCEITPRTAAVSLEGASTIAPSIEQAKFRRLDGSEFPVDYVCTPIVYDEQHIGAVLTFKDISERLAVERLKNEFLSMVSHELRTPLTPIQAALGLLNTGKLGQLSSRGQDLVAIALTNTERLRRLINDLLDFQRLESGKMELSLAKHSLSSLINQSIKTMQVMADSEEIDLEVAEMSPELQELEFWVDSDRFIQVLTNLISNAIKFSPKGETVSLHARLEPTARQLCLQIRDRGRGIPPEHIERIFDPFQQVDASDSRQKGGTGLGLTICRRLVEQHGGQIWAENLPEGGTQICLVLPIEPRTELPTFP